MRSEPVRRFSVDTLPLITGGFPANPTENRSVLFRRRLVARIHGAFPPALHHPAALLTEPARSSFAHARYFFAVIAFFIPLPRSIDQRIIYCQAKRSAVLSVKMKNTNKLRTFCGEKFTKCSLHSRNTGCIMVAIYWMFYANKNHSRFRMEEVDRWYAKNAARITPRT